MTSQTEDPIRTYFKAKKKVEEQERAMNQLGQQYIGIGTALTQSPAPVSVSGRLTSTQVLRDETKSMEWPSLEKVWLMIEVYEQGLKELESAKAALSAEDRRELGLTKAA